MSQIRELTVRVDEHDRGEGDHEVATVTMQPRWLYRSDQAPAIRPVRLGRFRSVAYGLASASEESKGLTHLAQTASMLQAHIHEPSLSVAVTSIGKGNRGALTSIGLASLWARWNYKTILVIIGQRTNELGRSIRATNPKLADILTALECGQDLPTPQPLTTRLNNLDAVTDLGRFTLGRIADSGLLGRLCLAFRQRYERVVWSLPVVSGGWSPFMLASAEVQRFVVSIVRGRTDLAAFERLAADVARVSPAGLQVVWHQ